MLFLWLLFLLWLWYLMLFLWLWLLLFLLWLLFLSWLWLCLMLLLWLLFLLWLCSTKLVHGDGLGLREWVSRGIGDSLDAIRTPPHGGWPRPLWIECPDGSETHWMLSTPLIVAAECNVWLLRMLTALSWARCLFGLCRGSS